MLDCRVIIHKPNIPRPLNIPSHKLLVTGWTLILGIPRQHALYAHAYARDVLHGAPALGVEKVQADDAVGVDVGVYGDGALVGYHECYFGGFCMWDGAVLE